MPHFRYRRSQTQTLTTAPAAEPVSLSEVKDQLRITHTDEDTLLAGLIVAAREYTEAYLSRAIITQTWDVWTDAFPPLDTIPIELPVPPLISVTHVKYYDNNDTLQTWSSANYVVDTAYEPGIIYPARNKQYPATRDFPKTVNIQFVAGFADSGNSPADLADNVPQMIKQAMLMLIGHLYENRESTTPGININQVPTGYKTLLAPYKMQAF